MRDSRCREDLRTLSLFSSEGGREVTVTGPAACGSQQSCAALRAKLMTLMDVSGTVPCDPVMHR